MDAKNMDIMEVDNTSNAGRADGEVPPSPSDLGGASVTGTAGASTAAETKASTEPGPSSTTTIKKSSGTGAEANANGTGTEEAKKMLGNMSMSYLVPVFLISSQAAADDKKADGNGEDVEMKATEKEILEKLQVLFLDTTEDGIVQRRLLIDGDGAGDDKRLGVLTKLFFQLVEGEKEALWQEQEYCKYFRSVMKQTDYLRSAVKRTVDAIQVNYKARVYWEQVNILIQKDIKELRTLITAHTHKVAEIELRKQQDLEKNAIMRLIENDVDRQTLMDEIAKREEELINLMDREAELDVNVKQRKIALDYLCNLAKRLNDEDFEVVDEAVSETDEKAVLSDISIELE